MRQQIEIAKAIFGVETLENPVPVVVTQNQGVGNGHCPPLSPAFVDKSSLTVAGLVARSTGEWVSENDTRIQLHFPFPRSGSARLRSKTACAQACLFETGVDFLSKHKTIKIEDFDFDQVGSLFERAQEDCATTLLMENGNSAVAFLKNLNERLLPQFKYVVSRGYELRRDDNVPAEANGKIGVQVTFYPIAMCIPIFNRKDLRAVGIGVTTLFPDLCKTSIRSIENLSAILSNTRANVLSVDGQQVESPTRDLKALTDHFSNTITSIMDVIKKRTVHQGGKKKVVKEEWMKLEEDVRSIHNNAYYSARNYYVNYGTYSTSNLEY